MASISSAGIGSGLKVEELVASLMAVERQPIKSIDKKEASYQAKLSTFGTLKSSLAALQTAARALSTPASLSPLKASVADSAILGASSSAGAVAGNYQIEVKNLAEAQKLKTATGFSSPTDIVGQGKITLKLGSYGSGAFVPDPAAAVKEITIDASNQTLSGIRDAINAAGAGVSASIINDGTSNYLSLTSNSTGTAAAMQVSVDTPALQGLAFDGAAGSGMEETVAASNALLIIDGVAISKPANTITDAIEGVTLNLNATTAAGVTTKLSLVRDTASVKTGIENFVKAYNDVSKAIADATAYDPATGKAGPLNGDSTVRSIQAQLRSILNKAVTGAPTGSSTLAAIGVTAQRDGSMAIDNAKLNKALADPNLSMVRLFAFSGENKGYGMQLDNAIGRILSPVGLLPSHTNSINNSIKDLAKQRDQFNTRLAQVERRYLAQFSALDTAIANMASTSAYLTQQLASLASNN